MTVAYVRHALVTALRVARFENNATGDFDHTFEGFFRSFIASLISLPLYIFFRLGEDRMLNDAAASTPGAVAGQMSLPGLGFFLFEGGAYFIDWLSMPLAMIGIVRLIGANHRYVPFVIAYNWGSCVVYAAMTVPVLIYLLGLANLTGVAVLYYAVMVFVLTYRWRLAREALQISSLNAVAIVIVDVLLSVLVTLAAAQLRGEL